MTITHNAFHFSDTWSRLWSSDFAHWLLTHGVHISRISRRLAASDDEDSTVRSEAVKHRQAVASVISSVAIAVLYVVVSVDVLDTLGLPIGSLVAPAAVLGAALGFGDRMVTRTLPGKQFDVGRRLRQLVVAGLRREGISSRTPSADAA